MKKHDLILLWRKRISNGSIAGTTLRNQGKGIVQCARAYLIKLDLSELHFIKDAEQFDIWLDQKTAKLQTEMRRLLKRETGNDVFWDTARKSLNLYLLESCYNTVLREAFVLSHVEDFLEVPLDSQVAKRLQEASGGKLPKWHSFKWLKSDDHKIYQDFALSYARKNDLKRAQLDLVFWRSGADE